MEQCCNAVSRVRAGSCDYFIRREGASAKFCSIEKLIVDAKGYFEISTAFHDREIEVSAMIIKITGFHANITEF
jgi:hypothetical protein